MINHGRLAWIQRHACILRADEKRKIGVVVAFISQFRARVIESIIYSQQKWPSTRLIFSLINNIIYINNICATFYLFFVKKLFLCLSVNAYIYIYMEITSEAYTCMMSCSLRNMDGLWILCKRVIRVILSNIREVEILCVKAFFTIKCNMCQYMYIIEDKYAQYRDTQIKI